MQPPLFQEKIVTNPNLLFEVLLPLDYDSIINYCRTYTQAQEICRSGLFWRLKAQRDLGISPNKFNQTKLSPAQRYLQLLSRKGGLAHDSYKYITLDEYVRRAIQQNRPDLVKYAIQNLDYENFRVLTEEYAAKGDLKNLQPLLLLGDGNYVRDALRGAVKGNQRALFDQLRGQESNIDWNTLALAAVNANNRSMFDYILSIAQMDDNDWNWSNFVQAALAHGYLDFYDYLRGLVPDDFTINAMNLAIGAAAFGNIEILNNILRLTSADYQWNWSEIAESALENRHSELFKYILKIAPSEYEEWEWNLLATTAISTDQAELLNVLPEDSWNWEVVLSIMAENDNIGLKQALLIAPSDVEYDPAYLSRVALRNHDLDLLDLIQNKDWNEITEIVILNQESVGTLKLVFELAPEDIQWDWVRLFRAADETNLQAELNKIFLSYWVQRI